MSLKNSNIEHFWFPVILIITMNLRKDELGVEPNQHYK